MMKKRITALLLALSMGCSAIPLQVAAAELEQAAVLNRSGEQADEQAQIDNDDSTVERTIEDAIENAAEDVTEDAIKNVQQADKSAEDEEQASEPAQQEDLLEPMEQPSEPVTEQAQAEWKEIDQPEEIAELIEQSWTEDYFQEAVIDTKQNRLTVDGERTSVKNAFGVQAEQADLFDSPETVAEYFEDTAYETQTNKDGTVTVTAPYQSCRVVVKTQSLEEDYGAQTVLEYSDYQQYVLQFETAEDTSAAYQKLSEQYGDKCYVDRILTAEETLQSDLETLEINTSYSWGTTHMGMDTLKRMSGEQAPVTVAIIDTGIDTSTGFFEGKTISKLSCAFTDVSEGIADVTGHGTHVAGIVADCTPDNAELMILRAFNKAGKTTELIVNTALQYAVENGADVINLSLGEKLSEGEKRTYLDDSLKKAKAANVVVCVAAGNFAVDVSRSYPANSPDTIAVGAITQNETFASYSCYGDELDFAVAGSTITSANAPTITHISGKTRTLSGTSMASPHMAAVFSYLKMQNANASVAELYETAKKYCVDLGEEGKDSKFGWGYPKIDTLFAGDCVHSWQSEIILPTCTTQGYTVRTCENCSVSYRSDYKDKLSHEWSAGGDGTIACHLCGAKTTTNFDEGLTWNIDKQGILTITGAGAIKTAPWLDYYTSDQITALVLKGGITEVGKGLFSGYSAVKTVDLGDDIKALGDYAFYSCTSMVEIHLPEGLTSIGTGALSACTSLASFDLSDQNTAFALGTSNAALYRVQDNKSVALVAFAAGYSVNGNKFRYYVPETVTELEPYCVTGSVAMSTIVLHPEVKSIGSGALKDCTAMNAVYMQCNAPSIAEGSFEETKATVYISQNTTGWGSIEGEQFGGELNWECYVGNAADWTATLEYDHYPYTGEACEPAVTMFDGKGTRYSSTGANADTFNKSFTLSYDNNIEPSADGATVTIAGRGIYFGSQTVSFSINNLCKMSISLAYDKVTYDGTKHEPAVTVLVPAEPTGFAEKLTEGTDYTVSYTENQYAGTALVTVNGMGTYCGTLSKTFTIETDSEPTITKLEKTDKWINVKWSAVKGCEYYCVMRKSGTAWKTIAVTKDTAYADQSTTSGVTYTYTVAGCDASGNIVSGYNQAGVSAFRLDTPKLTSASNIAKGIQVKWSKVNGAEGYWIYRRNGTNWKKVGTVKGNATCSYVDTGATSNGTVYQYTVRAYKQTTMSGYVSAGVKAYRMLTPSITSLKSAKAGQVTVKWKTLKNVSSYQVQYSTSASFTAGTTKTKTVSKGNVTLTKLSKGKKLYVRVRTTKKVSGKTYYSLWSTVTNVKVKK